MYKITVTRTGITPEKLRQFPAHVKGAVIAAAKGWRDNTMPLHFEKGAAQKYDYEPRAVSYQRYKNRRGLGPLQFKGRARRRILADRREPSGTVKRVTLRIAAPPSFGRRYSGWHKTMGDELTTILPTERRAFYRQVQDAAVKSLTAASGFEKLILRG